MGAPGNIPGETNALQVQVPCIIFFVLTPLFVTVRIWSRFKLSTGLGWDDHTLLSSFACCLTVAILMMISVHYGFGQHIYNLSRDNLIITLKLFYVAQIFYKLTINLTKASILLLYLRIFPSRPFRRACLTLLTIILLYMVGTSASSIWQCYPIPRAWDRSIEGTCISLTANWYANAGFSILTDVIIIVLPQGVIWKSALPEAQKHALMGVFALGGFVTVTSVLRMTTLDFSTTSPDTTYDIASTLWTMIEMNVAIICACLPMCRLPLAYLFPSILGKPASQVKVQRSSSSELTDGSANPPASGHSARLGAWGRGDGAGKAAFTTSSVDDPVPSWQETGSGGDEEKGFHAPQDLRGGSEERMLRPVIEDCEKFGGLHDGMGKQDCEGTRVDVGKVAYEEGGTRRETSPETQHEHQPGLLGQAL